jgi:energy-coupling factor transporter ATP-binding protein EcfA2
MQQKRVAFVVGHENWGKSRTLEALKQLCGHEGRRVTIGGCEFLVRTMSNDDMPESYLNFARAASRQYLIAALCPKFKEFGNYDEPMKTADEILHTFRGKGYQLFFWVIEHKWADAGEVVAQQEISELQHYGTVEIFTGVDAEAPIRATEFRTFVANVVSGPPA